MNKTLLLVIVMILFVCAARSQSHLGLKAGLNLANQVKTISIPQVSTTKQNTKPFVGYQLGVFYKTKLYKRLSLSAETIFSVIGSSMMLMTSDGKSYDTNEKLGYIELPLSLQYSVNKLYFGVGPSVGFKMFSKLTNFENRTYDISYYKAIDAAGNLLAGYTVTSKIDVNVRYSHGMVNLYDNPGYAKSKNRFFNFSVLYSLY